MSIDETSRNGGGSTAKRRGPLRRFLSLGTKRETAFLPSPSHTKASIPDTSLVLEERREQMKDPDWKRSARFRFPPLSPKRVSFLPSPSDTDSEYEVIGRFRKEEWSGDGKGGRSTSSADTSGRLEEEGGGGGGGGGGGRTRAGRTRDMEMRRHTLSAPDHRYTVRAMDLEMGSKANRRKSPQPRGYPPPPNMLLDDDPGIMSEVETSSTGFRRGNKQRSSLPVVRTPSKTLERPLGLVFLQYRSETKRALLPNEITSIDTVKALFVRSFPKQLTMEYMESPHVKIYIHDSSKDMFYELEDLRSHLRDIRDRSVLRLFESDDVVGTGGGLGLGIMGSGPIPTWDQDQSYFSEPEFDSEYHHQHIHKTKGSKSSVGGHSGPPYYMTHSFPPGGSGGGTLPRGGSSGGGGSSLLRPYASSAKQTSSVDGYMSSPERSSVTPRGYTGQGFTPGSGYEEPYYAGYTPRTGAITPVIDEEASDTEGMEDAYVSATGVPGYKVRGGAGTSFPPPVVPQALDQTRLRVEHMERQLASLTGLVQKALNQQQPSGCSTPQPQVQPQTHIYHRSSSDRDRHKPTPPPKPVSLSPGQYESRNVYRDLQLTAEMYNHLRGLQRKAKDLRQEVRNLRRMSQTQAHTVRETIRDAFLKIRSVLVSAGGEGLWSPAGDETRLRVNREGDLYRQQMIRLESDLTELEGTVEELRGNVINRKTRVNMSDVEAMALVLSKSSKTVAELKLRFPSLQDAIKSLISQEMEKVVSEEKFLKEEPERLESALRRCKKLTGTLVTLKRLASVQEQRLPDTRLSPPPDEMPPVTPTSGKETCGGEEEEQFCGESSGGPASRPENPLDALLDELQSFSKGGTAPQPGTGSLRRLHSYPSDQKALPPAPPPRTSSKSPSESSSTESVVPVSRQQLLEQKHQELLRKQRALQEQYTRLQSLQRAPPPDLLQLKKTGSESNLLGKMGLTLAPTGSLSHLAATTSSGSLTTNTTTTSKIYETDIL
ncbi:coiled-coil domain-containing protein AGAP005037 isoform X14 [Cimex lectularius]|uniref:Actin interacting protein 3-like C-terminal domain-containing protein n=1 Tax=Cimex lectularius TaxID=79782 RepID=A0A8I6SHL7_CIMLE|nr:coiled-coil domain-containing protein AGAP005037 isoform X14 [Cimex lectularius]